MTANTIQTDNLTAAMIIQSLKQLAEPGGPLWRPEPWQVVPYLKTRMVPGVDGKERMEVKRETFIVVSAPDAKPKSKLIGIGQAMSWGDR